MRLLTLMRMQRRPTVRIGLGNDQGERRKTVVLTFPYASLLNQLLWRIGNTYL